MTDRNEITARLRALSAELRALLKERANVRPCSPRDVRITERLFDVRAMLANLDRKLDEMDAAA